MTNIKRTVVGNKPWDEHPLKGLHLLKFGALTHSCNWCFCVLVYPSPFRVLQGKTRRFQILLTTWSPPATIRSTSSTRDSSKRWSRGWRSGQYVCSHSENTVTFIHPVFKMYLHIANTFILVKKLMYNDNLWGHLGKKVDILCIYTEDEI